MSILAGETLKEAVRNGSSKEGATITPLLSPRQINGHSVDLRLGSEFVVFRRRNLPSLDVGDDGLHKNLGRYQDRVRVDFGQKFTLHPGQLVLACTFEYIALARTLGGHILGRSSWGRLGLIIETASAISPGFKGSVTLELANIGQIPLVLYPGLRVAQLFLHTLDGEGGYTGRYSLPTGPQFSRVHKDDDRRFWVKTLEPDHQGQL